jgi:hypothetical protein
LGTQSVHWKFTHSFPSGQEPHDPLQPSSPHVFPSHFGEHFTQAPFSQVVPASQPPQDPPHPSSPHVLWSHFGTQHPARSGHTSQIPVQQSPYVKQTSSQ